MRTLTFAAALVLLSTLTARTQGAPVNEHPKLPPGQGRELMIKVCSSCHEPEKVVDQEFDAAGWKTVVDQMAAQGAAATDKEFDEIVQYLAKAFPAPK